MIREHDRIENGVQQRCPGSDRMIDVGTLVHPNRYLCPICRAIAHLEPDEVGVEEIHQDPPIVEQVGWIRRLLRWLW